MERSRVNAAVSLVRRANVKLFGEQGTALTKVGAYKHRSGGKAMHVRDYCDNVSAELTSWKVKMYDVMSKLEKVPSGDKEKLQPYLNDIHMILESLNDRIAQLRTECPVSWDPQKKEVDEVLGTIKARWDEVSANIPW
jgi:predicted nuclease with TOPRIM domain